MPFTLSLPPLVVLLLLAFLWLVLLVLILWFAFGPRHHKEESEKPMREPRVKPRRDGLEATLKPDPSGARSPQPSSPRITVRVVSPTERPASDPDQDDFDDFNRSGNRRDDFDF